MKALLNTLFFLSIASLANAQGKIYTTGEGASAINGYDPVAYFTEGKPVKGLKDHSLLWKDATWYFSSEENHKLFKSNPGKYAPQFGGFCAYGVAKGYKVKTEPETWTIIGEKLYLNYDLGVQKEWSKNSEALIETANGKWPGLEMKD